MNSQILFKPSEKQTEFMEAAFSGKYSYLLFGGAIRGGKTYCALGTLLLMCSKYPGSRWAIVRDTLITIKRTVIPSFFKICPNHFFKSYNQDTQLITLVNGSEILLFSENYDEDKLLLRWRGLEVNGFVLEECNELQESSFYKAIERAGTYIPTTCDKPKPLILMTCNPSAGWVKTLFYDRWKNSTLPESWLYLPSKITDNPFIAEDIEYMKSLQNMPRYEYEVYVEGNWDLQIKTGGEFYKCFELEKHVGKCEYDPTQPIHLSFDDNVVPFLPAGVFQFKGTEIFMVDELIGRSPNNTVKSICEMFSRRYFNHTAGLYVYGDATANKEDTKLEKGHNFFTLILGYLDNFHPRDRVRRSNPSVAMRGSFINSILEKEVFGLKLTVSPNCKETITDFIMTKEAPDGTKVKNMITDPKTGARFQAHGHLTDLTDYFLVGAFYELFVKYQNGGRTPSPISYGRNLPKHGYDSPKLTSRFQKRISKNDYR
jgi:Phage terminase large subunit